MLNLNGNSSIHLQTPKKALVLSMTFLIIAAMIIPAALAEIATDKPDYAPTDTVYLTGSGFLPNHQVDLTLTGPEGFTTYSWSVMSDENGNFQTTYTEGLVYGTFTLTATDGITTQTTTFTDAVVNVYFRIEGLVSTTKSVSYSGTNNGGNPVSGNPSITTDATGVGTSAPAIGLKGTTDVTFTFPSVTGYTFSVNVSSPYTLPAGGTPTPSVTITAKYSPVATNTAPSGITFSGATINEGDIYNATVTFTDPDTDTWTATVNFGDGSAPVIYSTGVVPAGFDISHTYKDNNVMPANDPFTVTVTVDDGHVGGTGSGTAEVTVNNVAPVIGTVSGYPVLPVIKGTAVSLSIPWSDVGVLDTQSAGIDWGDGTTDPAINAAAGGSGTITTTTPHTYSAAGLYTISITLTDKDGGEDTWTSGLVVVYDPSAGFVTGGGWIDSPAGAYAADLTLTGKATFGFVSQYKKGANVPTGNTEFQFHAGDLNFKSTSYDWLVVAGSKAIFKGVGTINGAGSYGFMLTASDKKTGDLFRIKIWDIETSAVIYDNQLGASDTADPTTLIAGGSIVVH
jgi:hypothetical protein